MDITKPDKTGNYYTLVCMFRWLFNKQLVILFTVLQVSGYGQQVDSVLQYVHIAHTRTNTNTKIDTAVLGIDFNSYDMVLLGGDMELSTSSHIKNTSYIDSIFGVSKPTTLWSYGNHDDFSNLQLLQKTTNKKPYYAYYQYGITFLVLHTQDTEPLFSGAQLSLINHVLDTIQKSSHLVLLHHKLLWLRDSPDHEFPKSRIANGYIDKTCYSCVNPNNFYTAIYPKLVDIKQRGVEVICLAGDIGRYVQEFEYQTKDGIDFLASGIEYNTSGNKVLMFKHSPKKRSLSWEFISIESLHYPQ